MKKTISFFILLLHIGMVDCHVKNVTPLYSSVNIEKDFVLMAEKGIDMTIAHTWEFWITGNSEADMLAASAVFKDAGFIPTNMYTESEHSFYRLILEVNKIYTPVSLFKDTQMIEKMVQQLKLRSFEKLNITK